MLNSSSSAFTLYAVSRELIGAPSVYVWNPRSIPLTPVNHCYSWDHCCPLGPCCFQQSPLCSLLSTQQSLGSHQTERPLTPNQSGLPILCRKSSLWITHPSVFVTSYSTLPSLLQPSPPHRLCSHLLEYSSYRKVQSLASLSANLC